MTSPRYVREVLRPAIERGARAAGRDPAEVILSTGVILQVSEDRGQARQEAALQVGFYATTRTYRPVLEMHGFGHLVEPLRRAFVRRDLAQMAEIAMPAVGTLAIAGLPDECLERTAAFEGSADRLILGGAWVGPSPDRLAENHRAIVETFAPAGG
jgi:alkanesulfonate monooxygenase SsuD/methylene tetrahydromethanopterin reductase-like flavin-dependent oxidoreductase (luciferase family)